MGPEADALRLRRALRDLVALSTVPAVWVGREPAAIAVGLADVLVNSLYLDFVFVRLCDPKGGAAVEIPRDPVDDRAQRWSLLVHVAPVAVESEVLRTCNEALACAPVRESRGEPPGKNFRVGCSITSPLTDVWRAGKSFATLAVARSDAAALSFPSASMRRAV